MIPVPYTDGGGSTYARVYRVRCVCMCVSCTVVCSNDPTPSLFVVSLFFFFPQPSKEGANGNAATIIMFKMFKGLWTFPRARRCFFFLSVRLPTEWGFPRLFPCYVQTGYAGKGGCCLLLLVVFWVMFFRDSIRARPASRPRQTTIASCRFPRSRP